MVIMRARRPTGQQYRAPRENSSPAAPDLHVDLDLAKADRFIQPGTLSTVAPARGPTTSPNSIAWSPPRPGRSRRRQGDRGWVADVACGHDPTCPRDGRRESASTTTFSSMSGRTSHPPTPDVFADPARRADAWRLGSRRRSQISRGGVLEDLRIKLLDLFSAGHDRIIVR